MCEGTEHLSSVEQGNAWCPLLVHASLQLPLHFSEVHVIILCVIHGEPGAQSMWPYFRNRAV